MKKNRQKKSTKRTHAALKGLVISWADANPLLDTTELINNKISHRNPTRRLMAQKQWAGKGEWLAFEKRCRWLVTITVVFDYPNGVSQCAPVELEAFGTINEINDTAKQQIKRLMNYGAAERYSHTEFELECIGVNP